MLKRIVFLALFLWSTDFLFSQENPHLPLQERSQPFFVNLEGNIPEKVWKAANESLVAVEVWYQVWGDNRRISESSNFGIGFVVWENYILANLHLFGEHPALWFGTDEFPTVPWIFDSRSYFSAELVFYDHRNDLALLKVNTPNKENISFDGKPVKIFEMSLKDQNSVRRLAEHKNFYAFGHQTTSSGFLFPLELGPFRTFTNVLPDGYFLDSPMGILQGGIQQGFSGGPLFSPKGEVFGVVTLGATLNTYVVTTETVSAFLTDAMTKLQLDSKGKPLPKPDQVEK